MAIFLCVLFGLLVISCPTTSFASSDVCNPAVTASSEVASNQGLIDLEWYLAQVRNKVREGDSILRLGFESDGTIERTALRLGAKNIVIAVYEETDLTTARKLSEEFPNEVEILESVPFNEITRTTAFHVVLATDLDSRDLLSKGLTTSISGLREADLINDKTKIIPQCIVVGAALGLDLPISAQDSNSNGLILRNQGLRLLSEPVTIWTYNLMKTTPRNGPRIRRLSVANKIPDLLPKELSLGVAVWIKPYWCSTEPPQDWNITIISRFEISEEPWVYDPRSSNVRFYAGTTDVHAKFFVAPSHHVTVVDLDAASLKQLTGAEMPKDFSMRVGRRPLLFVKSQCSTQVDLYKVILGTEEIFLQTLFPGEEILLETFAQSERVEIRRNGEVLDRQVLSDEDFAKSPLYELNIVFRKC